MSGSKRMALEDMDRNRTNVREIWHFLKQAFKENDLKTICILLKMPEVFNDYMYVGLDLEHKNNLALLINDEIRKRRENGADSVRDELEGFQCQSTKNVREHHRYGQWLPRLIDKDDVARSAATFLSLEEARKVSPVAGSSAFSGVTAVAGPSASSLVFSRQARVARMNAPSVSPSPGSVAGAGGG